MTRLKTIESGVEFAQRGDVVLFAEARDW